MQGSFFARARRFGAGSLLWTRLFGVLSAVFPPILLILLGLAAELLIDPAGARLPEDPLLRGSLGRAVEWPIADPKRPLIIVTLVACLVALLQAICVSLQRRAAHWNARKAAGELKNQIHAQAFRLGCSDVLGTQRSLPEELFTERVETVRQGLAAWWRSVPYSLVLLVALLAMALVIHIWIALLAIVLAILIWRVDAYLRESGGYQGRLWNERAQQADTLMCESLSLTPLATGYSLDSPPGESFPELLRQQVQTSFKSDMSEATRNVWFWMFVVWGVAFLLLVIGLSPTATVAGSIVLVAALASSYFPARRLYRLRRNMPDYERAAKEIFTYLERTPTVVQMADAKPLEPVRNQIRVESVTLLDRRGQKLLDEVSAAFPAGSRIAIASTDRQTPMALAGLLVRFYDPVAGRILFDDFDIRWAHLDSVRRRTSLVLNDALLLTGSVAQNIGCGRADFNMVQIHDSAKKARAIDFILDLPDGFETIVGEQGMRLEPSKAFRIALARAVIGNPTLMVIEEPDGGMPEEDAAVVDAALQDVAAERTLILLPRRLATLRGADLVLLFHQGRLVASGKHGELLQSSELYRHLNYQRFNPFPDIH